VWQVTGVYSRTSRTCKKASCGPTLTELNGDTDKSREDNFYFIPCKPSPGPMRTHRISSSYVVFDTPSSAV